MWRKWIHQDIRQDVVGMYFRRQMWRDLNDMLLANPTVGEMRSSFWNFHHDNYAVTQAIAIRRQADKRKDTCSLRRLLEEVTARSDLLRRETYVALLDERQAQDDLMVQRANAEWNRWANSGGIRFDGVAARADALELEQAADRVKVYVDEHLAHDAATPTIPELPTLKDLHAAIEVIGSTFQKYAVILTGGWWDLEHMIEDNWRAIFRVPWIAS
jgi:hypothetical protein